MTAAESALVLASRPSGAIAVALANAGLLQAVTEGKCNLVTPALFLDRPPAMHRLAVRAVTIDVERETYKSPNGKEGEVALGAVALQRIAKNAQVSWDEPKRLDDCREAYLRSYSVGGSVRELDGTWTKLLPGVVTLDFRGEPGWPEEKLGADTRRCLQNAEKKPPSKRDIPAGTKGSECKDCKKTIFWVKTQAGKNVAVDPDGLCHFDTCAAKAAKGPAGWTEVFQARAFIDRLCVTKAMSACIRKLGIPSSLPKERAEKPWVVMALVQDFDMNDPDQKAAAIAQTVGASSALYGGGPRLVHHAEPIDVTPEPEAGLTAGEWVNGDGVIHEAGEAAPEPWEAQPVTRPALPVDLSTVPPERRAWFARLNELTQAVYDKFGAELGADHLRAAVPANLNPETLPATEVSKIGAALKALV